MRWLRQRLPGPIWHEAPANHDRPSLDHKHLGFRWRAQRRAHHGAQLRPAGFFRGGVTFRHAPPAFQPIVDLGKKRLALRFGQIAQRGRRMIRVPLGIPVNPVIGAIHHRFGQQSCRLRSQFAGQHRPDLGIEGVQGLAEAAGLAHSSEGATAKKNLFDHTRRLVLFLK